MGLREVKKERARSAILKAARELFFSLGYDGTTVEAMAQKAEVAVGTVYNYFESKSSIILAITDADTNAVLRENRCIPESASGLDVLRDYVHTFMESLSMYPRKLLGELMREAFSGAGGSLGEGLLEQDLSLIEGLAGLLERLSGTGRLRDDFDPRTASLVIYGIVMTSLMWFTADENRTSQQMLDSMDGMLEIACRGLEPKGEATL
ncbi:MAG: TetR/AcrR family transcriptional regulator [Candidatus Fermentibacteraceae bacterium]|nr:TetR/AcrR family transcriptional regulator [Candidatus Fermentibacteraceae bacterium]MBN2609413.1 TetR/AcrR family transcriptional regulator [Candidatus Fermentibacteraceae bacterium]